MDDKALNLSRTFGNFIKFLAKPFFIHAAKTEHLSGIENFIFVETKKAMVQPIKNSINIRVFFLVELNFDIFSCFFMVGAMISKFLVMK